MAVVAPLDTSALDTWPKVLEHNSRSLGARRKAMRYKHYGIWQSYSWADYLENVKYLALGLLSLGFQPGNKLLIVGDNSPQWYFAELAAQCDRGISVGVYSDLSAPEIEYIARNSEAEFAMVEDQEQADKIAQIRDRLPALRTVVYWRYKGLSTAGTGFIGLRDVVELGRHYEAEHPGEFEENLAAGKADDVCAIVYTSGTTGQPKGALHSYRSLMAGASAFCRTDGLGVKDDLVSYLPPSWIAEQWLAFGCHLLSGSTINFAENAETQQDDAREIAPTAVLYNSRLWESLAGQVQAKMRAASRLKRLSTRALMPVGYKLADVTENGGKPGVPLRLANLFADLLVFRRIRDSLGLPHARVCYSCGSSLSADVLRFFHALGVPLKNVYSSTEAGSITGVAGKVQARGTVGCLNEGIEIQESGEGELVVRHSGVFLGYYKDPEATAQVLRDGWVHTGDRCYMKDGQMVFVDRLTDLISLPCGDVVPPQEIESRLKYSPYIKDAWVLQGPDCESLSAVVIIDMANAGQWADKAKVGYTTFRDLSQKPEIYGLIEKEIAAVNQGLPETQRIKKFVNLHKEFDPDEAELTRNRKLRRTALGQRYVHLVQAFGGGASSVEVEADFTYQDGRVGKLKTAVKIATIGQGDR
jgi:long-chain acyl-CoA synthetase